MHKLSDKRASAENGSLELVLFAFNLLHPIFLDRKGRFILVGIHKKEGYQLLELGEFASTHESCYILSIMENSM